MNYYLKNKALIIKRATQWNRDNPIAHHKSVQKYRRKNPERVAYYQIRQRCNSESCPSFKYYGGRGIKCLFVDFTHFLGEVGYRPGKGWSIDRINNNGHYSVGNVRWVTAKVQANNRREYPKNRKSVKKGI